MSELINSYDWAECFGEGSGGNTYNIPESLDGTSTHPCSRHDVKEIIAAVNGENDGNNWIGVFELQDGRFLSVDAGCDYTGWDWRASNTLTVASSLESLIETGLNPSQCERLNLIHPKDKYES